MTLKTLSKNWLDATGNGLGFVIKSLAHPERKFKVEALLINGDYAIVRIDTGKGFVVCGDEDRYELAMPMARVREVKAEIVELSEQYQTIGTRLGVLKAELGDITTGIVA